METLMKQIRVKFTGAEEENKPDPGGSMDQKIQSFKEKKKAQNWFQRQISRNMSDDYDYRELEHATAVAAAALAITSQGEVSEIPQEKKISEPPETSLARAISITKAPFSKPRVASKRSSGSFKYANDQGNKVPISSVTEEKPEKAITPALSRKKTSTFSENLKNTDDRNAEIPAPRKTPTFGDKNLMNTTDGIKPETPPPIKVAPPSLHQPVSNLRPPPPPPPPIRQTSTTIKPSPVRPPTPPTGTRGQTLTRVGPFETKADAWERNELLKIKERYEKLIETIDSWEKRKKMKARRKLNKKEQSENQRERVKASKKYQSKMKYIDEIAGGARAEAAERRRNEELKSKEKANIIRTTGKLPRTCFCL